MAVSTFRPIYYLGCKISFLPAIKAAIDDVDPSGGRLCDLFSGTGVVGAALSSSRAVTAVDIQEYSRVLCSAQLRVPDFDPSVIDQLILDTANGPSATALLACLEPLVKYEAESLQRAALGHADDLIELIESPPLASYGIDADENGHSSLSDLKYEVAARMKAEGLWSRADTTVSQNFGGLYFSFFQAATLDMILTVAELATEEWRDTVKAAVLSTASQLVNTIGKQFAQPIRPRNKSGVIKRGVIKAAQRDRALNTRDTYAAMLRLYSTLPKSDGQSVAIRQDYLAALVDRSDTFSAIYADPPYTRDHYSRFYHVLETMCLRDDPAVSQVTKQGKRSLSRGMYRLDRHQSPFCIRSSAPEAFEHLFRTGRESDLPIVLSYSPHEEGDGTHPRVVSSEQIVELAKRHYQRVEVLTIKGVMHNQLNRRDLKLKTRDHAEILLKCYR